MTNEFSWLDRAKRLIEYHPDALDFIRRAGEQLPVSPGEAGLVSRLWSESDMLDGLICNLLEEMNVSLRQAQGEVDTTRGVAVRATGLSEESIFYECSWSLLWDDGDGISVNLAIEPGTDRFDAEVRAIGASEIVKLRYPFTESDLKDALTTAYVAEATKDGPAG